jgi:hypothetical protein
MKSLKSINFENGLECIDLNLSDSIITFCDYRKKNLENLETFFNSIPVLKRFSHNLSFDDMVNYFVNDNKTINYYSIRDFILSQLRESMDYLNLRLKYITDKYDIDVNMSFINTVHKFEVEASYLNSEDYIRIKDYDNLMDSLDILEIELEKLKTKKDEK